MVTGGTPPLKVDPELLGTAGGALLSSAGQLPSAPAPFMPIGTDPLSVAIIGQIPAVETPVMTQLPVVQTQSTTTAQNVIDSAQAYTATDHRSGAAINEMMQNSAKSPAGAAGGSPAGVGGGGADSMGQMMSMPMQMASQMAQMPMQVMGAVAAVPQGLMQGVQQVGQQVQQMAGQFGQGSTGTSASRAEEGTPQVPGTDVPAQQTPDAAHVEQQDDGAGSGEPDAERAPDPKEKAEHNATEIPGRHRAAEPEGSIDV